MDPVQSGEPESRISRLVKAALLVGLVLLIASSSFLGGMLAERFTAGRGRVPALSDEDAASAGQLGSTVEEAAGYLDLEALKPSDEASMTHGAVQGLLDSLGDKYANYFDARHYEYFNQQNAGQFGGIGVTLQQVDGATEIVEVIKGTPADKAGMKSGDRIYGIDGERREAWDTEAVVGRVRGAEGTTVTIEVKRAGAAEPRSFTMVRARINIPNIESRMIGSDVGYIALASFNERSSDEVADAIRQLDGKGAEGFVLDLRDDPGGLLGEAVDVVSLFVADGVAVSVQSRTEAEKTYRVSGDVLTEKPLVVLVNGHSASASEIVAGALQDFGRAKLVGEKTFGKGSVQTIEELSAGGAIKFTVAHYLTPKKRTIDGVGLTPEVVVVMKPELAADPKTDTQLTRALQVLRAQL